MKSKDKLLKCLGYTNLRLLFVTLLYIAEGICENHSVHSGIFIDGLAREKRVFNASTLQPFTLSFKTLCSSGILFYNSNFSVRISEDGNLTYEKTSKSGEKETSQFHHVADSFWHSIVFNGSSITLHDEGRDTILIDSKDILQSKFRFFDGFLGCVSAIPLEGNPPTFVEKLFGGKVSEGCDMEYPEWPHELQDCHDHEFKECHNCKNEAECVSNETQMNNDCVCGPAHDGSFCEFEIDNSSKFSQTFEDLQSTPTIDRCHCANGGTCQVNDLVGNSREELTYRCICPGGFSGENCTERSSVGIEDKCVSQPCQNGALCIKTSDNVSYNCYCRPGYSGDHCEIDFNECLSNPCLNGATCNDRLNGFDCQCTEGFEGKTCEKDKDECLSNPCQNGALCHDLIANYSCECIPGYTGRNCDVNINECDPAPCKNNGTCLDKVNKFECNCEETGFEGETCEQNVDDCENNLNCENGANCIDMIKGYSCNCYPGYDGKNCSNDIKECGENPCNIDIRDISRYQANNQEFGGAACYEKSRMELYNGGIDAYTENTEIRREFSSDFSFENAFGYMCECKRGFNGTDCRNNINDCAENPCERGKCEDGVDSYTCSCPHGFEGTRCELEINECLRYSPCYPPNENTFRCKDLVNDYECTCLPGYGDKNCSTKLIACDNSPCMNNGTCNPSYVDGQHIYTCDCIQGFSGEICEKNTTLSFDGAGKVDIVSLPTQRGAAMESYELRFRFRTTLSNVLVVTGYGVTYYSLTLNGEKLYLQTSLLNNLKGISSGSSLSNGQWAAVSINVNRTHVALAVNSEQTIHPIANEDDVSTVFNRTVIGGANERLPWLEKEGPKFFVGCIQDIVINGRKIIPEDHLNVSTGLDANHVKIGCVRNDQCNPNPCENRGVCKDLWQSFICSCERPNLGNKCQYVYEAATFGHENITLSYAKVKIHPEVSRKFGNSFNISMFVRTREPRGTIFFLGNESRETSLFMKAQVEEDGQLAILAKLDENREEVYNVGGIQVNDGSRHLISIHREKGLVTISVNGNEHFRKSLKEKQPGPLPFNPTVMYIGGVPPTVNMSDGTIMEEDVTAQPTIEIKNIPLVGIKMKQFKGVIQDVRVNVSSNENPASGNVHRFVVEFYPLEDIVNSSYSMGEPLGLLDSRVNVERGVVSDDSCKENPCKNNGSCNVTWNDFECSCKEGYAGKDCGVTLRCAMVQCPDGTKCRNLGWEGFECVTEASFDGSGSFSPHYHIITTEQENVTFNDIRFSFRTQIGGTILHLSNGELSLRIDVSPIVFDDKSEKRRNSAFYKSHLKIYINRDIEHVQELKIPMESFDKWLSVRIAIASDSTLFLSFENSEEIPLIRHFNKKLIQDIIFSEKPLIILGSDVGNYTSYTTDFGSMPAFDMNVIGHPENEHNHFRGCLREVSIGNFTLPFVSQEELTKINSKLPDVSMINITAKTAFYIQHIHFHETEEVIEDFSHGCVLCYKNECKNNGHCENPNNNFNCTCDAGYAGPKCEEDINECLNHMCEHGECVDEIAMYTCKCHPGYEGSRCDQQIDECDENPCKNGGTCSDLIANYTCQCEEEFEGRNCEKRKLASCSDFPCKNGATCISTQQRSDGISFKCRCPQGYEGMTCSETIDYCQQAFCYNNATCMNIKIGYQCICQPGFTGPNCLIDIDDCASDPCQNNGTCFDLINAYNCECNNNGYEGIQCRDDINECLVEDACFSVRHLRNHVCKNTPGNFTCDCPEDKCGPEDGSCEYDNPCYNKDICGNFENSVCKPFCTENHQVGECVCKDGFEQVGNQENLVCKKLAFKAAEGINVILIIIPTLATLLLIITIGIVIMVKIARKKRATRGVYSPSQQEYCNPRVELDNVLKPPPEERLI